VDLIVGAAIGYTDEETEPWRESLKRTGYPLEQSLLLMNAGELKQHPIVARFHLISLFASSQRISNGVPLPMPRYVIATDVKDLVFQSDPIAWLEKHLDGYKIMVQSEGQFYRDCFGNKKNILEAFGEEAYEKVKDEHVINAGVIAGRAEAVSELCREIYELCLTDQRKNVQGKTWDDMLPDQSALNLLLRSPEWRYDTCVMHEDSGFVSEYQHKIAREVRNGVLYPAHIITNTPYVIWHQYWWTEGIREKYRMPK
jgi:hypothetical protein